MQIAAIEPQSELTVKKPLGKVANTLGMGLVAGLGVGKA